MKLIGKYRLALVLFSSLFAMTAGAKAANYCIQIQNAGNSSCTGAYNSCVSSGGTTCTADREECFADVTAAYNSCIKANPPEQPPCEPDDVTCGGGQLAFFSAQEQRFLKSSQPEPTTQTVVTNLENELTLQINFRRPSNPAATRPDQQDLSSSSSSRN